MNFRLTAFDALIGKPIGLWVLAGEVGWLKAIQLGIKLELKLKNDNPFDAINKVEKITPQKASSQQQMSPVVALYSILVKNGYSKEKSIVILDKLVTNVAFQFLKFNIPIVQKSSAKLSKEKKLSLFKKISSRFFNAEAVISLPEENAISFDVHFCHFAYYCKKLGIEEIGYLFCKADKIFFEKSQPNIEFSRSKTVMEGATICDFRFKIK